MAYVEPTVEEELLALVRQTEDERGRVQQRLQAAQRSLVEIDERLAAYRTTLDAYRQKYGLPKVTPGATATDVVGYSGQSTRGMIDLWADKHGGRVAMRDLCKAMTVAGLFKDPRQAAGTLYSTIQRMPNYKKVGRGVYERQGGAGVGDAESPQGTFEGAKT